MDEVVSKKNWIVSFILCLFCGLLGIHNFYAKKIKIGIIQLLTLGGLGIWTLIDLICIIQEKYKDNEGNIIRKKVSKNEAFIISIVPTIIIVILGIWVIINLVFGVDALNNLTQNFEEASKQELGMQVYLFSDATQKQIDSVEKMIRAIDGVSMIEFVSKEDALNTMKERFKDKADLLSSYEGNNNILPASFIVKISDQTKFKEICKKIEKISYVKKVAQNDLSIKTATVVVEQINFEFIILVILIITFTIDILGKIIGIILICKKSFVKEQ